MAAFNRADFSDADLRLSDLARALAHPARVAILRTLAQRGTCICGELVEVLPLAQSTVSQHLRELKEAGLIVGEVDGPRSCYCLNEQALAEFFEIMRALEPALLSCCGPEQPREAATSNAMCT